MVIESGLPVRRMRTRAASVMSAIFARLVTGGLGAELLPLAGFVEVVGAGAALGFSHGSW